jgi:putative ABC transport system permease protein
MSKITFASLRAHKRRLIGMFLSIVLGVAFLSGTLVLGDTLQKNFDNLFGEANAGTDVVVRRASQIDSDFETANRVMDASIAKTVAAVPGVADAQPYIEGFGGILDRTASSSAGTARRPSRAVGSTILT